MLSIQTLPRGLRAIEPVIEQYRFTGIALQGQRPRNGLHVLLQQASFSSWRNSHAVPPALIKLVDGPPCRLEHARN